MSAGRNAYALLGITEDTPVELAKLLYHQTMRRLHTDTSPKDKLLALDEAKQAEIMHRATRAMTILKESYAEVKDRLPKAQGAAETPLSERVSIDDVRQMSEAQLDAYITDVMQDMPDNTKMRPIKKGEVIGIIERLFREVIREEKGDEGVATPQEPFAKNPAPREWRRMALAIPEGAQPVGLQGMSREEAQKLVNSRPEAFKLLWELQQRQPEHCLYDAVMALIKPRVWRQHQRAGTLGNLQQALGYPEGDIAQARQQALASPGHSSLGIVALSWLEDYVTTELRPKCARRTEFTLMQEMHDLPELGTRLDDDAAFQSSLAAALPPPRRAIERHP